MKYYTAHSYRGSSTSKGFVNDTMVLIWYDYQSMQNFLDTYSNISVKRIKRKEATRYATNYNLSQNREIKPDPFKGEFWGIDQMVEYIDSSHTEAFNLDGLYGELIVCDSDRSHYDRFYKTSNQ